MPTRILRRAKRAKIDANGANPEISPEEPQNPSGSKRSSDDDSNVYLSEEESNAIKSNKCPEFDPNKATTESRECKFCPDSECCYISFDLDLDTCISDQCAPHEEGPRYLENREAIFCGNPDCNKRVINDLVNRKCQSCKSIPLSKTNDKKDIHEVKICTRCKKIHFQSDEKSDEKSEEKSDETYCQSTQCQEDGVLQIRLAFKCSNEDCPDPFSFVDDDDAKQYCEICPVMKLVLVNFCNQCDKKFDNLDLTECPEDNCQSKLEHKLSYRCSIEACKDPFEFAKSCEFCDTFINPDTDVKKAKQCVDEDCGKIFEYLELLEACDDHPGKDPPKLQVGQAWVCTECKEPWLCDDESYECPYCKTPVNSEYDPMQPELLSGGPEDENESSKDSEGKYL